MSEADLPHLFYANVDATPPGYYYRITWDDGSVSDVHDPYRFVSTLPTEALDNFVSGRSCDAWEFLGSRATTIDGVEGTVFALWAPNASRVSVVGDFNQWDGRRHRMRFHPAFGVWDIFLPQVNAGSAYKYELADASGNLLPLKSDPMAQVYEVAPANASVVADPAPYEWSDDAWMATRPTTLELDKPVSIYEMNVGSWRAGLGYRELADELVAYVCEMGFTHVEFMPLAAHPYAGSWGYQPIGLFAADGRSGAPADLKYLVDQLHRHGIGVILDWVCAHFPRDEHGLARFDGTALYEHSDPRRADHPDWGTLEFNLGRYEVVSFLISNCLYWIESFHIDAIRVDAVASMLYLDYSREDGQWVANEQGGNEDFAAVRFLQQLNTEVHQRGGITIAEESTAWPGVSRPVYDGGLGFTYKWNMGWMNDTLSYMSKEPVHRKYHHNQLTFGLMYAYSENFVLPLSHDEVVHGKRSLIGRMPGDTWQRFANLRLYYCYMLGHPGKKLLFMGGEFAQNREWNHNGSLDWKALDSPWHHGIQTLVRDLNRLYREIPALYEADVDPAGFEWIDPSDADLSILTWLRWDARREQVVLFVSNFTPVERDYRVGVPESGDWRVRLNSDGSAYGGSNRGSGAIVHSDAIARHGRPQSLTLQVPALATLILMPI